jgi:hypothetical protein
MTSLPIGSLGRIPHFSAPPLPPPPGGGAFSLFGPIAAGIGAGLNLAAHRKQTKGAKKQLLAAQQAINEQITRARVKRLMDSTHLSEVAFRAQGTARVALAGQAGRSSAEAVASIAQSVARSQVSLDQAADDVIEDYQRQKQQLVSAFNSQTTAPILAMLQGAGTGYLMGGELAAAFRTRQEAKTIQQIQRELAPIQWRMGALGVIRSMMQNESVGLTLQAMTRNMERLQVRVTGLRSRLDGAQQIIGDLSQTPIRNKLFGPMPARGVTQP